VQASAARVLTQHVLLEVPLSPRSPEEGCERVAKSAQHVVPFRVGVARYPGCRAGAEASMGRRPHFALAGAFIGREYCARSIAAGLSRVDPALVFESLTDVITASDWVYVLIVLIAALDAVFPLVPSEATVIAAAALAGAGDLVLGFVLIA